MAQSSLIEVEDLRVYFPTITGLAAYFREQKYVRAVDEISFSISRGEIFSLVGESGCGKTSTGLATLKLLDEVEGSVRFDGVEILELNGARMRKMRERIQMIFQDPYESLNPRMNVEQIVSEPLKIHGRDFDLGRIRTALKEANLAPDRFLEKYPYELSGGERQRVAIAAALILEPEFLVLDEPVSNLDVSIKAEVLNLFLDLKEELGLTYLFITHDLADTFYLSDDIAVMYLGKIVESGGKDMIKENPLHPYTKALLSVVPTPGTGDGEEKIILEGDVPDPIDLPSGCRFNPRCPQKIGPICEEKSPGPKEIEKGHLVACHLYDD